MSDQQPCCRCGSTDQIQLHHQEYRSNGGTHTSDNLLPLCQRCHTQLHSSSGDFARWGRLGGQRSAARRRYLNNLKQFRDPDIKLAYLAKVGDANQNDAHVR